MLSTAMDPPTFIRANTKLLAVPLVPEIRLHIAEESLPIWQKTEEELGAMNVPPPYWAFAWAGGQALARFLLDNPAMVADRCVLDLGSGSGLVAIAAAKAGAQRVLAADIDVFAVAAIALNAAANGVTLEITADDLLDAPRGRFRRRAGRRFVLRAASGRARADVRRGRPCARGAGARRRSPPQLLSAKDRFRQLAEYSVPVTRELEDAEIKRTYVWRFEAAEAARDT